MATTEFNFRITKKNFISPAVFHQGVHYFPEAVHFSEDKPGHLTIAGCYYHRQPGYSKWKEDSFYLKDTDLVKALIDFAIKRKVITETPDAVKAFLKANS